MLLLLAVLVILVVFGGGWTYTSRADGGWHAPGLVTFLLILLIVWLLLGGHP